MNEYLLNKYNNHKCYSSKTIPHVHSRIKPPPMLYDRHCVCIRSKYIYVVNSYFSFFRPPFPQCYLMENIFNIFMQNIFFLLLKNVTNISGCCCCVFHKFMCKHKTMFQVCRSIEKFNHCFAVQRNKKFMTLLLLPCRRSLLDASWWLWLVRGLVVV